VSEVRLRAVAYKLQSHIKSTVTSGPALRRIGALTVALVTLLVLIVAPVIAAFDRSALAGGGETGSTVSIREVPTLVMFNNTHYTRTAQDTAITTDSPISAMNHGLRDSVANQNEYAYYNEIDDTFSEYNSLIRNYPATDGVYNDPELDDSFDGAWGDFLFEEAAVPTGTSSILLAVEEPAPGSLHPAEANPASSFTEIRPVPDDVDSIPEKSISGVHFSDEYVADNISNITGEPEDIPSGTPALSLTASTGSYIWPANGTLSSTYGRRSTSVGSVNHKGIDVSGPYGTPVFAADGGEVVFSGWNKSFGYMIQIRHDNGHETLYAHCSLLLVSEGDSVAQGQEIARMGKTGTATGVHVHFELIINGKNVDPLPYLQ